MQEGEEDADGLFKACALIRSNLHIDPPLGSDEEFAHAYAEALWLEEIRFKKHAELLTALFGKKE